jgi:hypothetical protein
MLRAHKHRNGSAGHVPAANGGTVNSGIGSWGARCLSLAP